MTVRETFDKANHETEGCINLFRKRGILWLLSVLSSAAGRCRPRATHIFWRRRWWLGVERRQYKSSENGGLSSLSVVCFVPLMWFTLGPGQIWPSKRKYFSSTNCDRQKIQKVDHKNQTIPSIPRPLMYKKHDQSTEVWKKGWQILLSRAKAESGITVQQQHKQIYLNHIPTIFSTSLYSFTQSVRHMSTSRDESYLFLGAAARADVHLTHSASCLLSLSVRGRLLFFVALRATEKRRA